MPSIASTIHYLETMYHISGVRTAIAPGAGRRCLPSPAADMRRLILTRAADPYVLSKLAETEETFNELQVKMADPDVSANQGSLDDMSFGRRVLPSLSRSPTSATQESTSGS